MNAQTTPAKVVRQGIRGVKAEELVKLRREGKRTILVCRGERTPDGAKLTVAPEVAGAGDLLAAGGGTSNVLMIHTDLMGTVATVSINPGVEQTAYGLFVDLVDIARSV